MIRANLKNLSYQTIAQIIPRAMMFIFTFYLARILGLYSLFILPVF